MQPFTIAVDPSAKPCKICGTPSPLFGVVDFNKSCRDHEGIRLPLSGIPIYYRRCPQCTFAFTDAFDSWTPEDFRRHIYNADYEIVDPEYTGARAVRMAEIIDKQFGPQKAAIRMLDYGGGNGQLASIMSEKGYNALSYDPFVENSSRPAVRVNFITCFEVMEHTSRPLETLDDLLSFLEPDGVIMFSTALQPANFDAVGLGWWYAAPRNGHVSLHSANSLITYFASRQLELQVIGDNIILAVPKSMRARHEAAKTA